MKPALNRYLLILMLGISTSSSLLAQSFADSLSLEQEKELKTMLDEALKAKPGSNPLNLGDAGIKRAFDLASRVEEYSLLKLNKSMMDKKYTHDGDFVGYYISRFGKLFEEKAKTAWILAYAAENKTEKAFFDKVLEKTGLKAEKRNTIIVSHYHLVYPAERVFYMEIVSIVYKNGEADFSMLNKRAKDWVAERSAMFP